MEVLYVLIPVSIALAAASVVACLYAIRGGQFDDLESPPWRILFEDRKAGDVNLRTNTETNEKPLSVTARRSAPL